MKIAEKVQVMAQQALAFGRRWAPARDGYPTQILDLIVFHKLHLSMDAEDALRSFRQLKDNFVDWNEVRISSVREIQDVLGRSVGSLELAVFVKDLLEFVHRERQDVSLEFLADLNLGEIRKYLKQVKGLDTSTVDLILRVRKEHPVFPLTQALETVLSRLGLFRQGVTRDRKEKLLHEMVEPEKALVLHHYLLNLVRKSPDLDPMNVRALAALQQKYRKKNSPKTPRPARRGISRASASGRIMAPSQKPAKSLHPRRVMQKTIVGKRVRRAR